MWLVALLALLVLAPAAEAAPTVIRTVAGNGATGFAGDGGPAVRAQLSSPSGTAVDGQGAIYVADFGNHRVRRVGPDGIITTIAGNGIGGFGGDGGPGTAAQLFSPTAVAVGPDGAVYIADAGNYRVRRVGPDGVITTIAGTGSGEGGIDGAPPLATPLRDPAGIAVDAAGRVLVSDTGNDVIRRIDADGVMRIVAGVNEASGYNGDGQPAVIATLDSPGAIAVHTDGSLFVADTDNHRIRRVGPDGLISTIAGTGPLYESTGDGGPATAAALNTPVAVAVDAQGVVFVGEAGGNRIRRIATDGRISTLAGDGTSGFTGELGPPASARLGVPWGLGVDALGRLLVADRYNHRIRRIGDLRPDLGTVARAFASARRGGPARIVLPARASRLCATFRLDRLPEFGLPLRIVFRAPGGRTTVVGRPRATQVAACVQGPRATGLRSGRWTAALQVAGQGLRTLAVRVRAG